MVRVRNPCSAPLRRIVPEYNIMRGDSFPSHTHLPQNPSVSRLFPSSRVYAATQLHETVAALNRHAGQPKTCAAPRIGATRFLGATVALAAHNRLVSVRFREEPQRRETGAFMRSPVDAARHGNDKPDRAKACGAGTIGAMPGGAADSRGRLRENRHRS